MELKAILAYILNRGLVSCLIISKMIDLTLTATIKDEENITATRQIHVGATSSATVCALYK